MNKRRTTPSASPGVVASTPAFQTLSAPKSGTAGEPGHPAQQSRSLDRNAAWILARRTRSDLRWLLEVFERVVRDAHTLADYVHRELRPPPFTHSERPWHELSEADLAARWKVARKFNLVRSFQRDGRLPPTKRRARARKLAPPPSTESSSGTGGAS